MKQLTHWKKSISATATAIGLVALSLHSNAGPHQITDVAKVTNVQPIYKTIEHRVPQEMCWVETVRIDDVPRRRRSSTPTLVGGIIGGVIGNEIGRGGDNKKIGAVVGTLLGMSIARDIDKHHKRHEAEPDKTKRYEDVERCEVTEHVETEQVLDGYNVSYIYANRHFDTFMKKHPGKRLRVAVNVKPIVR